MIFLRLEMVSKPFNFYAKKSRLKRLQARHVALEIIGGSNPRHPTLKGGLHGRSNRVVAW